MRGQAFIYDKRVMLALPVKANQLEVGQLFKKRDKKKIFRVLKHQDGQLVAEPVKGEGTEWFSRDYPLMMVI